MKWLIATLIVLLCTTNVEAKCLSMCQERHKQERAAEAEQKRLREEERQRVLQEIIAQNKAIDEACRVNPKCPKPFDYRYGARAYSPSLYDEVRQLREELEDLKSQME